MSLPLSGSNIRILRDIPWRSDYKHTRYFSSVQEQTNWFLSKTPKTVISQANFVKIEGKNSVQLPYHIDTLWDINYMMFQNENYDKWFYCFVTKLEYLNKNTTRVYFEIDAYQTWFLYTNFQPSYIERQHVTEYVNGQPTINTIEEGLNYGSMYDTLEVHQVKPSGDVLFMVIVSKTILDEVEDGVVIDDAGQIKPNLNGVVQPLTFYIVPFLRDGNVPTVTPANVSPASQVLEFMYEADSAVNNIVSIYTTDYIGLNNADGTSVYMNPTYFKRVTITKGPQNPQSVGLYRLTSLYAYETKTITVGTKYLNVMNYGLPSKLYMSPYYKIFLTDFQGNQVEIKPEYINSPNLNIKVKGSIGTSNKVSYEVLAYNYQVASPFIDQVELEYGIINQNPNDVPIITDLLSAYLQGNRNSLENQTDQIMFNGIAGIIGGTGSIISGAITRDVGSAVGGLGSAINSTANGIFALQGIQAKQQDIANTPPSISNQGGNNYFTTGNGYKGLYVIKKFLKAEYQETLGDFFKRYGYKWNRVELPNLKTRQSYNFVKTLDSIMRGSIPQEYLIQLQTIFDNGITLWHTDDIGNYNLGNEVI